MMVSFPFLLFFMIIVLQRIVELLIAKNHEKWMKQQGAVEFGSRHYYGIVFMHLLFLGIFFGEKVFFHRELSPIWFSLFCVFLIAQFIRIWAIISLGKYWNTKILVLPFARVVKKGPYRFIKHPNYLVVSIEFAVLPLMFDAYITAILFSFLNAVMLSIRIPEEEKALKELTEYEGVFRNRRRFLPKLLNKYDS